ncbi:CRISPR-associated endoribonuclease Cas6 [Chondrinema litorale]|uniref:CRISPR-associated endoribonuclease Cas6 n=1 Tax=Chondrinema litorale TaxID=2994555 RepID=UPI0025433185|nr:CRISPR-associated endoribonuclease Cas6 [Chondrinema litorale]UZR99843.1 hypothetical protein OQ292_38300 [Chondrinema litorale]
MPDVKVSYNIGTQIGSLVNFKVSQGNKILGKKWHDEGELYNNNHKAKLSIARIRAVKAEYNKAYIKAVGYDFILDIRFYIPSIAKAFDKATLLDDTFTITDNFGEKSFKIIKEKRMKPPKFFTTMNYQLRTPSALTTKSKGENEKKVLNPKDSIFIDKLQQHLLRRTELLYRFGNAREGLEEGIEDLSFKIIGDKLKEKKIFFRQGKAGIKGYEYNFQLTVPIEVHKMIYFGGFLESTSQGFGYLDTLPEKYFAK